MTLNTTESKDSLTVKWERRKRPSTAYAPSLRSGATMALWANKSTGILFGGVTDEDTSEETLESVFWNDLSVHLINQPVKVCSNIFAPCGLFSTSYRNGYQLTGNGRWMSMTLKRPKKSITPKRKKGPAGDASRQTTGNQDHDSDSEREFTTADHEIDPDDPHLTIPLPRYNAMLVVLRNTLYMYEKCVKTLDPWQSANTGSSIDMVASMNEDRENTLWMTSTPCSWINWIDTRA
jgi:hypothetical protein